MKSPQGAGIGCLSIIAVSAMLACSGASDPASPQGDNLGPFGKDLSKPDIPFDSLAKNWTKPMWSPIGLSPKMDIFDTCGLGQTDGQKGLSPIPDGVSAIALESPGSYVANVKIFDKDSVLLKDYDQHFGYCGELANVNRQSPGGYVSFVGWDGRNDSGVHSQEKVVVWRMVLTHRDGSRETKVISMEWRR